MAHNSPQCPIRFGEPCTLCQAYVTGPEDCQTVALVMSDPWLREEWAARRREYNAKKRAAREATKTIPIGPTPDPAHN
ncbi:DUF6767 domain-containing protein [Arcanobacterium hippocoleae]|uniref:4Fe-4S Wbl-type domain-containing protein n=1 Tax=Arcanobacterium hippocoleae TaxID=149017 RepID=A0ABU1SZQ0_9ACTO|nr:DUF6767 domain-containing protein [Arcanobacterium hippocoleae]MDR6938583.1 hypothetical protein [Arcanobacterium hippocoleae]